MKPTLSTDILRALFATRPVEHMIRGVYACPSTHVDHYDVINRGICRHDSAWRFMCDREYDDGDCNTEYICVAIWLKSEPETVTWFVADPSHVSSAVSEYDFDEVALIELVTETLHDMGETVFVGENQESLHNLYRYGYTAYMKK